jgi:hypothetical protein
MRSLGDTYVKSEFRLHRSVSNPIHLVGFLSQWKIYLEDLEDNAGDGFKGRRLDPALFEKMSSEQIYQLHELMSATKDLWRSEEESVKEKTSE